MNYGLVSLCLLLVLQAVQGSDDACPALPNTEMAWSRGRQLIDAINEGRCLDISDKCGECADQCLDPAYSHWIDKYCAKTCGLCQDEAELVKRQSGGYCWNYNKGYGGSNVLKQVEFTTVFECERLCLKDRKCTGASITEFNRTPAYCVLGKSGNPGTMSRRFGATKDCMEQNPMKPCSDAWNRCSCCMKNMCKSRCPTYKSLLSKVCQKTCGYCSEEDNEGSDKDENNGNVEWKEIDGVKLVGKVLKKKISLKEAKEYCSSCGGINCKGKKCMVVGNIKKKKKKDGFTAYEPED